MNGNKAAHGGDDLLMKRSAHADLPNRERKDFRLKFSLSSPSVPTLSLLALLPTPQVLVSIYV